MDKIESKKILNESVPLTTIVQEEKISIPKKFSISESILQEFGYDIKEAEITNPWQGKDAEKAAIWAALSPEDQKWLGAADPTDQTILSRAPNKGRPTQSVDPSTQQGQALAAQTTGMDEPASGVAGVQGGSQQDNMLAAQNADMDDIPATEPAAAQTAPVVDPNKLKRFKELLAKATTTSTAAPTQAAAGQTA